MTAQPNGVGWNGLHDQSVQAALLARRVVLAHGELDGHQTSHLAASLMLLDASGDEPILLRLTSADGPLESALAIVDAIGVLGVPVDTAAAGTVAGGAVGVLAVGRRRVVTPHTRLHLREPDGAAAGRAVDIERAVAESSARRDRFYGVLASRTGRPVGDVAAAWSAARWLDPLDAVALGYADEVEQGGRRAPDFR